MSSGYLARLKEVEKRKNFHNSPESELTKLTEAPFGGFVSSSSKESEKKFNDSSELPKISGLPSVSFVSSISEENKKNSDIESQQIEMVRAWLHRIGEPVEDHDIVLNKCRNDWGVLGYFLKHAQQE